MTELPNVMNALSAITGLFAQPSVLGISSLAVLIGGVLFRIRTGYLQWFLESNTPVPDARPGGYSPGELKAYFRALRSDGRRVYTLTQLSLDMVFPFAYTVMFAAVLTYLGRLFPVTFLFTSICLIFPLGALIFDLLENITLLRAVRAFDALQIQQVPSNTNASVHFNALSSVAARFVNLKSACIALCVWAPVTVLVLAWPIALILVLFLVFFARRFYFENIKI
jgi:hypothetical protein